MPEFRKIFYNQSLKGIGTDCSFVFKGEDGQESIVHAHRSVLSAFSSVIATNLKDLWKGNGPIEVTSFSHEVFQAVIKAIYMKEVDPLPNLKLGVDLYEAAHFYLLEDAFKLAREKIIDYCDTNRPKEISKLTTLSLKFEDYIMIEFVRTYFTHNADDCLKTPDFLNYPTKAINMLYQIEILNTSDQALYDALEKYVEKNGEATASMLKSAVAAICSGCMDFKKDTLLLNEEQKRELELGQRYYDDHYSPKRCKGKYSYNNDDSF